MNGVSNKYRVVTKYFIVRNGYVLMLCRQRIQVNLLSSNIKIHLCKHVCSFFHADQDITPGYIGKETNYFIANSQVDSESLILIHIMH